MCTVLSEIAFFVKGFRQNRTQFAVPISLDKKLKDQSKAIHSPFLLFYTTKALHGKHGF